MTQTNPLNQPIPFPYAAAFTAAIGAVTSAQQAASDQFQVDQATIDALHSQIASLKTALGFTLFAPMPDDVVYTPVKQYCIDVAANGASDTTGTGTPAAPFATILRALQQVSTDRGSGAIPPASASAVAEISYRGGQTFTQDFTNSGIHEAYVLFDSYGGGIATIKTPGVAFQRTPDGVDTPAGFYLQYLDIVSTNPPTSAEVTNGVNINGIADVGVDYCLFSGFTFNMSFYGVAGLRTAYNFIERALGVAGTMSGSGLFMANCSGVLDYGNFFYHNGWDETVYTPAWWADVSALAPHVATPANTARLQSLVYFHGEYRRDDSAPYIPTDSHDNFYILSASTGLQIRTGGSCLRSVFKANGYSSDVITASLAGTLDQLVLFGESFETFPFWGQGVLLQAQVNTVSRIRLLSASTLTQNAAIEVKPATFDFPAGVALPAALTTINDVSGRWPVNNPDVYPAPAAVWVDPTLESTTKATGVNVRAAKPGEYVLSLLDLYGVPNDQALAVLFKANFRNWRADLRFTAQYVWAQADKFIAANP